MRLPKHLLSLAASSREVQAKIPFRRCFRYVKNDVTGTVRTRLAFRLCGMFVNQDVVDMRSVQQAIKGSQSLPETTHS